VTQSFGGYGIVTGQRIGLFGAYGTAPTLVNPTCPTCQAVAGSGQPFSRLGVDVSLTLNGEWNLFGAWMWGNDSKNMFVSQGIADAQNASWNGAFVELDYAPALLPFFEMPDWFFAYRYDLIRNNRQGDPTFAKNYNNVDSHTVLVRYFIHHSTRTDSGSPCGVQQLSHDGRGNERRRSPRSDDAGRVRFCVLNAATGDPVATEGRACLHATG
jgi:hypothetical protein